jgi:hypothetical protein
VVRVTPDIASKSDEALEAEVLGGSEGTLRRGPGWASDDDAGGRFGATSMPAVAPRLLSAEVGAALMGRRFGFDAPLQGEQAFPRGGVVVAVESFPLAAIDRLRGSWLAGLGVGASFARELASAAVAQADGGTLSYHASEGRWSTDLRYAVPLGRRFVIVPLAGYGRASFDVQRRTTVAPSMCPSTSTQVCFPGVSLSHLTFGFDARAALTPSFALSLGAALLPSFGVGRGPGQIGAESDTTAIGYSAELGATYLLLDWLALRAAVPVVHYGYSFGAPTLSYGSASETIYGLVIGATVMTM